MAKLKTTHPSTTIELEHEPDEGERPTDHLRRRILGVLALGAVASACSASESLNLDGAARQTGSSAAGSRNAGTLGSVRTDAGSGGAALDVRSKPTTVTLPEPTRDASSATSGGNAAGGQGASSTAAGSSSSAAPSSAAQSTAAPSTAAPSTAAPSTAAPSTSAGSTTSTTAAATATTAAKKPLVVELPDDSKSGAADKKPAKMDETTTTMAAATGDKSAGTDPNTTTSTTAPAPTTEPAPLVVAVPVAADASFVANRITFGLSPALSGQLASLGTGGFIEDQLQRTQPDPAVESRLGGFILFGKSPKATYDTLRDAKGSRLSQELAHSNILRSTFSGSQLYEMMCQLWMDHFNIYLANSSRTQHLHVDYQENVIRPNAMGNFRQLLRATAEAPGMLTYLNNDTSNARSEQGVNENYGRELLELHTLGIDESGNQVYDESDVLAAARAMSGWSMVNDRGSADFTRFQFRSNFQYEGDVSLLGGAWTSQGTSGKQTGESMLDFLATHPSTARHIAYKICRRFVGDNPPAALVASTAQVFLDNNTELVPTLRHVLLSPEFSASPGQKFRRPFEHLVAALRAVDARIPDNPTSDGANQLRSALSDGGHLPWGWPAPNGYPDSAAEWLDGSGLSTRWTLGARLARNRIEDIRVDHGAIAPPAATVGELIAGLGRQFGIGTLSQPDIDAIAVANRVTSGDSVSALGDEIGNVIGLVLATPLFQIR